MSESQSGREEGTSSEATTPVRRTGSRTGDMEFRAIEIEDSRGRPTVQVTVALGDLEATGDVPAGASTGVDEARTVSVKKAIANINKIIAPLVREGDLDLRQHQKLVTLERHLIERAGENFEELGANAVVPVSRALWQMAAKLRRKELAQYIRQYEPELASQERTRFFMNVFNGGLHALRADDGEKLGKDRIDIQEIMVVPMIATNYRDALAIGDRIDATLKDLLSSRYGSKRVNRGDEAGFSVKGLGDSEQALAHVFEAIERAGYAPGAEVKVALDVAASSFFDGNTGKYQFSGHTLTSEDMISFLVNLVKLNPGRILSIEDGLDENDWEGWSKLSAQLKEHDVTTVGDDLFVTQMPRLRRGVHNNSAQAILIKVNQNGSMSGTMDVMKFAKEHGMKYIISHRSGETLDTSIADLAFACGAMGIKTGAPQPEDEFPNPKTWVRRSKYLRLIDLEESSR